jgi:hypothetical protein
LLACQKGSLQVAKPFSVLQEASAIPFAALTAWRALHGTAGISEGYVLLYSSIYFLRCYTPQFGSRQEGAFIAVSYSLVDLLKI